MHQIWDQNHRDREVREDAVRTLDQGQETELGDGEIYNAADQGCNDLVTGDLSLRRFACVFHGFSGQNSFLSVSTSGFDSAADPPHHRSHHIDRRGDCPENNKDRDQRCHKCLSDTILNHK